LAAGTHARAGYYDLASSRGKKIFGALGMARQGTGENYRKNFGAFPLFREREREKVKQGALEAFEGVFNGWHELVT